MKKIFYNGNILTLEKEGEYVEAILVENGIIAAMGSYDELRLKAPDAEGVDLEGRTMMPAFIDGHSHFPGVGMAATSCDLSNCSSFDDIVNELKAFIEERHIPEGVMVMGANYDHNFLKEGIQPSREVLDRVSQKHPIVIAHASGHTGVVNSMVLDMLGLDDESEFGQGGKYCRDEQTGRLNGQMEENAFHGARALASQPSPEDMMNLIVAGQEVYLKNGITTVQNGGSVAQQMEMLKAIGEAGKFKIDIVNYMMINSTTPEEMSNYSDYIGKYKNRIKIGGYKMFLDGSPQCKTAWLSKPYEGETEYAGYPILKDEQALAFVNRALDEKMQLLTHCNGDQASEQLITSFEQADAADDVKRQTRPVMIHCQTVREDQLERMKEIGMLPSIFVAHVYYWGDVHVKNLGPVRGSNISPARTAIDKGHVINFHQDSPVTKPDMLFTIWCAVNRISREGRMIGAGQRITVYEALRACTYGGAYEYFEENEKGTIKEGKLADLIILDRNPMTVNPMDIKDIKVLETIKEGTTVYTAME